MSAPATIPLADLASHVGRSFGPSDWFPIDQDLVNRFADLTHDHQFIHVDVEAAKRTPLGGTIAHGFLTLSLQSHLAGAVMPRVEGATMVFNYGFDKLRFVSFVRVGARIRAAIVLKAVEPKGPGQTLVTYGLTVEIEGESRPAIVADWLSLVVG